MLLATSVATAQEVNFNFLIDKTAHLVTEIEAVQNKVYLKQSLEFAPMIEGGFFVAGTSLGLTTKIGMFENYRIYAAPKIQFIVRGGYVYPSLGAEMGIDKFYNSGLIIGIRGTYDYRSDFEFWGNEFSPEWRPSGFIKIGWKIK